MEFTERYLIPVTWDEMKYAKHNANVTRAKGSGEEERKDARASEALPCRRTQSDAERFAAMT